MAAKNWRQIFEKVRKMKRREFVFRSRQEISKRADALRASMGQDFGKGSRLLGQRRSGAFFFRPEQVEDLLRLIRARVPGYSEQVVDRAEKIFSHRFNLLGYENLDYGKEINWQLDAVHQKKAPRKPFYRIRYLDFDEVGDSKVTWELNRHQHLVTLAKAYRLTSNERYAREILSQWRSWHAQNPYPIGINWASSLEVAFRSLSWIWMRALLEATKFYGDAFRDEYLRAQALSGRHIERYLSTYFSPNTHLLGEAVALFFIGTMCGELRDAERWKTQGWQIVMQQAERQVNPDGMHFEQSVYYHVYALDFFLHAATLAMANGAEIPEKLEQTIERMMKVLFVLGRAGPPPRFGDDDGGRLFDPSRNRDQHLIDPLSTGTILFQRGEFKSLCKELREETIWLLGEAGVREWDEVEPKSVTPESEGFESSGIYVLSTSQARAQLIMKSGPSIPQTRGHAHADMLSVCLQSSGRTLLLDPGTYEYVGNDQDRNLYRSTGMHNAVTFDGQNQAEPDGPFSWKREIQTKTERWIRGETFDLLIGACQYAVVPQPAKWQRWVIALKSGFFLVRDLVEGDGEHRVEISWRLSPDLQMHKKDVFRVREASHGLALVTAQNHGWSEEVHKGPYSPVYGSQRTTTVLKFGKTRRLPAEFVTLLAPISETRETTGRLAVLSGEGAKGYRYEDGNEQYHFFFAKPGARWKCASVSSDARLACVAKQPGRTITFLCDGSYVEVDGKRVISAERKVDRCEVMRGESIEVFSSDPEAVSTPVA